MQRGGGAAIRHPYLRFMCTRCGGYHAVVLATCNWQQGAPQQGQRVRILARSSSLKANTAGALDLYRSMFYKRSTYIYISFMAGYRITPVLVFWILPDLHWVKFTSETGFELPSSCPVLPCYAPNRNRNILDFMSWHQIDLGAQDLNDIQRPKSFQKNSWK